jgi:LysM repeat protein
MFDFSGGISMMNLKKVIHTSQWIKKFYNVIRKNSFIISLGSLILLVLIISFSVISTTVTAEKSFDKVKLVTSVKIEKGESLWSIASRYISEEYKDMESYIKEIKKSNGLTSDVIHEGNYITIPYYTARR